MDTVTLSGGDLDHSFFFFFSDVVSILKQIITVSGTLYSALGLESVILSIS